MCCKVVVGVDICLYNVLDIETLKCIIIGEKTARDACQLGLTGNLSADDLTYLTTLFT